MPDAKQVPESLSSGSSFCPFASVCGSRPVNTYRTEPAPSTSSHGERVFSAPRRASRPTRGDLQTRFHKKPLTPRGLFAKLGMLGRPRFQHPRASFLF